MLTEFRSHARNIGSKILMAMLVITFGVWGIEDMIMKSGSSMEVASVAGQKISAVEYQVALSRETEKLRQSLGKQFSSDLIKNLGLEPYVLQQLINNRLLAVESKNLGLRVSDNEVVENIHKNPNFFDNKGKFSKVAFEAMLRSSGINEKAYIKKMREDMAVNILLSTVIHSVPVPKDLPDILLAARKEQRKIELYNLPPSLVGSIPAASEEQLKEYYDSHLAQFAVPEYRNISYIEVTPEDAKKAVASKEKEVASKEKDIETIYNERIDEFKKPERRKVEQLLFADEDSARKAYDSVKTGKTFEQIAKESNGKVLNQKNISLGLVEKSALPEEAADKVFSLASGTVSEPVNTAFGWHIFTVKEIVAPATLSLNEVRQQLEKELAQQDGDNILTDFSNKIEDMIAGGGNLAEVAKEYGLKIISLPALDKQGNGADGKPEKNLPKLDKFLEIAFKTEEKTESSVVSSRNGNNYILRVESVAHEHSKPFAEVKSQITEGWNRQERSNKLAEIASKIASGFSGETGRANTIKTYAISSPVIITVSQKKGDSQKIPDNIISEIFSHQTGFATGAFEQKDGSGYAIAVVKEIIPAAGDEKDQKHIAELADIEKEYKNAAQNEIIDQYLKHLAVKYSVSINESAVSQISQMKSTE